MKNYITFDTFYIGLNSIGNNQIIQMTRMKENLHWWFHFDNIPSCHLIFASDIPPTKSQLCQIKDLMLQYTKKANVRNTIIYTQLKNIKTTSISGQVLIIGKKYYF